MVGPFSLAMVATIWATASSMLLPVIWPKASFMFTVTMFPCVVVEITATSLGMAVDDPLAGLGLRRDRPAWR